MHASCDTLPCRRSTVRVRSPASDASASGSLPHEDESGAAAAHTPPTPPRLDEATRLLRTAIDAYRVGTNDAANRALEAAWRLCQDDVKRTIAGRVREPERRDDAEQATFIKLWAAVRKWNPGREVESASAMCRWFAAKASLNIVEARDRVAGREHPALSDETSRDIAEFEHDQRQGGAGLDDDAAIADYARLAYERAPNPEIGKKWAAIVLAVGEGHVEREDIGEAVGMPAVSVRREIFNMRRCKNLPHPRDGISKLEVLADWRTHEADDGDTEPLALFDFQWQEIS